MKKVITLILVISVLCTFVSCGTKDQYISSSEDKYLPIQAPFNSLSIRSSEEGVEDFLKLLGDYKRGYENEKCYNITPTFVSDNSEYKIFKFEKSCASFLQFDGLTYQLGGSFGGYGVTSLALADMNRDGQYELYFTYSYGSGIHRAQVGYFDPAQKQVLVFDKTYKKSDCILTLDSDNNLSNNRAKIHLQDFVNFDITADDELGTIKYRNNKIQYIEYTEVND
jgi:hypothetical protein